MAGEVRKQKFVIFNQPLLQCDSWLFQTATGFACKTLATSYYMDKIQSLINDLECHITNSERLKTAISKSAVGWHIQHSLLVIGRTVKALENSNPKDYKWEFNRARFIIYSINKIPRGKGIAPQVVQPEGIMDAETLKTNIKLVRNKVKNLACLHPNNYFKHPRFGNLNLKSTIKFLKIHTKHHLAIIDDIVEA